MATTTAAQSAAEARQALQQLIGKLLTRRLARSPQLADRNGHRHRCGTR